MRIGTRVGLILAVFALLLIACTLAASLAFRDRALMESSRDRAYDLQRGLFELNSLSGEYLVHRSARVVGQWRTRHQSLVDQLAATPRDDAPHLTELESRLAQMVIAYDQLVALPDTLANDGTQRAQRILAARLLAEASAAMTLADKHLQERTAAAASSEWWLTACLIALAVVSVAAVGVLVWTSYHNVLYPVLRLAGSVDKMGRGDLDTPITSAIRDEIGDLARQVDRTRQELRGSIVAERAAADELRKRDSELNQIADDLRRSNQDLEQFAYVASHDLRSPLRGIDQLAEWIEEDAGSVLPSDARQHLAMLRNRIRRMENLLADLLAFSQAGRIAHEIEPVDVAALAAEIADLISPPKGMAFKIEQDLPVIDTCRIPLQQVLTNLFSNAVKHHDRDHGTISFGGTFGTDRCELFVRDDGPGISEQYQARVFEMFQTLRRKDETEGTGIGLALVRKLIERQGGRVWIDSTTGQRGATFRFSWPYVAPIRAVSHSLAA